MAGLCKGGSEPSGSLKAIFVMDAIKTEPEVDPLAVQPCDDTIKEEENPSPDEGNLFDLHVTKIKEENLDDSYNHTSEIKFEEIILPINFPVVKCEAEEKQSDLNTVNEEPRIKVTAEENKVSTERFAATNGRTITSEFGRYCTRREGDFVSNSQEFSFLGNTCADS
ncbi:hypothetical protein ANN_27694 [Periplaneta americana]|uniref:Uncharacterized protein n=1 Tax=Periplaneta americana TaxID=6978 RepID=A0ABQ8RUZ0_PERAM|nr:hypothetical protein ANN_27694 [Periplaneta americana]